MRQHSSATVLLAALTALACGDDPAAPVAPTGTREITVQNGSVSISGTLDVPTTPGPHPVLVFVPGSGRTTRDDDRAVLSVALPQGVAVFRYDKRGLGKSTGTFEEVTAENSVRVLGERASDVKAIVDHLATLSQLQSTRIFLWGTSQGAWVAPLVASQSSRVAFVIAVNGGGSPVGTVIEYERVLRDAALPIDEGVRRATAYAGTPGYDPGPTLNALRTPVYWIFGGLDRNTPTPLDVARLTAIKTAQNSDFTIKVYPRMNHEMNDVDTGAVPSTLFSEMIAWAGPRLAR